MPYLVPLTVVLAIGVGLGWSLSRDTEEEQNDTTSRIPLINNPSDELSIKIDELILQLENERQARKRLETEFSQLKKVVLSKNNDTANIVIDDTIEEFTPAIPQTHNDSIAQASEVDDGLNKIQKALISVGMDTEVMDRIQKRVEEEEMQQLYVQNQARREGWYGTRRYFEELRKTESEGNVYREELGDERYDQFLFETGQNNRVTAQSVLSGSPAEKVGMLAEDIVLSYDGKRIFSWNDLTSATAKGDPDQMVRIEVLRNNEVIDFYVKRGPLGIRLGTQKIKP